MRSRYVGAFALILATVPFTASAYVSVLDFHGTSSMAFYSGGEVALPAAISDATAWDILGSIEFTYDDVDIDAYQITGGSLSVNGVSLGDFTDWHYALGYSDEGEDPYYASFSMTFVSEELGTSYFGLYSEDYSGGIGYSSAAGYLGGFPVGGYQVNSVMVVDGSHSWETDIDSSNLEFTPGEVNPPTTPVSEPSPLPLAALGLACVLWLRCQHTRA